MYNILYIQSTVYDMFCVVFCPCEALRSLDKVFGSICPKLFVPGPSGHWTAFHPNTKCIIFCARTQNVGSFINYSFTDNS